MSQFEGLSVKDSDCITIYIFAESTVQTSKQKYSKLEYSPQVIDECDLNYSSQRN